MKLNKAEKTGANTHELEILIEPAQLKDAISAVYRRDAKKYNVPGFRRGHAPRNLIEKMYGADVFHFDAVNDLFPQVYEEALKEASLEPISQPQVELDTISLDDGAVLKAVVIVAPQLEIGNYTGLEATRFVETVEDAVMDTELERMQERNARLLTREGPAQDGDIADLDYEGFSDGVPFDGGKGEHFKLTLGSGQFIPGFEEQVVGHTAGEEFDINVSFPEEYHAEDLAGKPVVFKIKLHEVQYKELPELDDEFAKDVSDFDTLDELKKDIRENLQKQLDEQADMEMENQLIEQIVETIEGEIPEVMYENRIDDMVRDFEFRLQQQGMNLETYMQFSGMDDAAFREGFKEQAEKQVKMRLALEAVVRLEGIVATEEDIEAEIARIAERFGMEADQVRNLMPSEQIAKDLAVNKAVDLVKEKAKVTDKPKEKEPAEGEKKAPAKKPAAKKAPAKKAAKTTKKADEKPEDAKAEAAVEQTEG
ncbi:MAG: trigger factor [Ruminococcaceae bacterium]|nr:trigger factor [Oscillospiraceae bacterium]